jgi:two-component system, NtrC family, sensor histidine kinase PilS
LLDAFVERHTRTVRGNLVLIAVRLLLATVTLVILLIEDATLVGHAKPGAEVPPASMSPAGFVAVIVCFLTVLYGLAARRTEKHPKLAPRLAIVQIFVDLLLISALVWNTGGVNSQFVVLYLISVSSAAFVLKWNVAILSAALAAILFSTVTTLYRMGNIPASYRSQVSSAQIDAIEHMALPELVRLLLLPSSAFFLTGILAGALARRLELARLIHDEILEAIGEGLLVLDPSRRTLYHNREFLHLLGLPPLPPGQVLLDVFGPNVDQQAQEVIVSMRSRRIEIAHRRPDGTHVPLAARLTPIAESGDPQCRGLVIALDDLTIEKRMEEFLKHKQRIETMSHISATIAHEIRNPMASIRGAVQEIKRSVEIPDKKRILLDIVLSESDRLDHIISDFLRYARMRGPRFSIADLGKLLGDVKLLLAARPEAADVRISLSGDEGDPCMVDPEQLRQVFLNLGVNALQAVQNCPKMEVSFRIRVCNLHQSGLLEERALFERADRPGVLIEVADSGPGLSAEARQRLFEPFFTTTPAGTGLGLAIVERIVKAHEGLITAESSDREGTTFKIWIPTNLLLASDISGLRPIVSAESGAMLPRVR